MQVPHKIDQFIQRIDELCEDTELRSLANRNLAINRDRMTHVAHFLSPASHRSVVGSSADQAAFSIAVAQLEHLRALTPLLANSLAVVEDDTRPATERAALAALLGHIVGAPGDEMHSGGAVGMIADAYVAYALAPAFLHIAIPGLMPAQRLDVFSAGYFSCGLNVHEQRRARARAEAGWHAFQLFLQIPAESAAALLSTVLDEPMSMPRVFDQPLFRGCEVPPFPTWTSRPPLDVAGALSEATA